MNLLTQKKLPTKMYKFDCRNQEKKRIRTFSSGPFVARPSVARPLVPRPLRPELSRLDLSRPEVL
jgi:hypothetical protein